MRTSRSIASAAFSSILTFAFNVPAMGARGPVPVSPGGTDRSSAVEARCPTFQWAGVPGARGYELAVFRLAHAGAEPVLVTRASVPGDARGFTPAASGCLERGARYAWSIAAAGEKLAWSAPHLFEVEAAPSQDELEQAIATIERYRLHGRIEQDAARTVARDTYTVDSSSTQIGGALSEALTAPTTGITRVASAVVTPTLGTPSLTVSSNILLGANSNLFKTDGVVNPYVFLWGNDRNLAVGRYALASQVAGNVADYNTAVGVNALRDNVGNASTDPGSFNTAVGSSSLQQNTIGQKNTAVGAFALRVNTTGARNVAAGDRALYSNVSGDQSVALGHEALFANASVGARNTAVGALALRSNTIGDRNVAVGASSLQTNTGAYNTAVGYAAGFSATGSSNIFLGANVIGLNADANTIRIGLQGSGNGQQNKTFIAGIFGVTTSGGSAVFVNAGGQLGTATSSRAVKQEIADLGPLSDRLLDLRPVVFRYRELVATDPDAPTEFGLIAEEVAEVFPELVVYDAEGKPQTVKYHLLSALLLGELQRMNARLEAVESQAPLDRTDVRAGERNARHRARR